MIYLLIVSIVWAFSFGLIKDNLTGLDSNYVSFLRIFISFIVFVPFLKIKSIKIKFLIQLLITGMVQFGVMYISYIYSFKFLPSYQVALFTIFTPIYITIINDLLRRRFSPKVFSIAILTCLATGIIVYKDFQTSNLILGFVLVQISNIAFAFGQIYYKKIMSEHTEYKDKNLFAIIYFGALIITATASAISVNYNNLSLQFSQILSILYLGVIASGVCFFLWNYGARKTDTGTLAIFNNLKIPIAIIVSLIVFKESANLINLIIGLLIILFALFYNHRMLEGKNNQPIKNQL
ncbi:MAG: EamA family transporter [Ignavibacteriales bacterium]|nr:EamA family transporter [Ignavibacteriales bacterium]